MDFFSVSGRYHEPWWMDTVPGMVRDVTNAGMWTSPYSL